MADLAQFNPIYVPAIVVISYLIGMVAKSIANVNNKYIPSIVGIAGGVLGVVGMYVIPDFPASDVMNAIMIGVLSGLASTGVDQLIKQVKK